MTAGGRPLPPYARQLEGGVLEIDLKVVPAAARSEIVGPLGDRLKVRVAAPPEDGRANRAVVELLREWLGAEDVEILTGQASAKKTLRVTGGRLPGGVERYFRGRSASNAAASRSRGTRR
ncbi:MAG TPA: DUF167 domain-containing protein [Thermoanaerobaculia bacterium]